MGPGKSARLLTCAPAQLTLAAAMSWAIFGAGIDWSRNEKPRPLEPFVDEIVAVLVHGAAEVFPLVDR